MFARAASISMRSLRIRTRAPNSRSGSAPTSCSVTPATRASISRPSGQASSGASASARQPAIGVGFARSAIDSIVPARSAVARSCSGPVFGAPASSRSRSAVTAIGPPRNSNASRAPSPKGRSSEALPASLVGSALHSKSLTRTTRASTATFACRRAFGNAADTSLSPARKRPASRRSKPSRSRTSEPPSVSGFHDAVPLTRPAASTCDSPNASHGASAARSASVSATST